MQTVSVPDPKALDERCAPSNVVSLADLPDSTLVGIGYGRDENVALHKRSCRDSGGKSAEKNSKGRRERSRHGRDSS